MTDLERFIKISWQLIEAKILYYCPPQEIMRVPHSHLLLTDQEYDALEQEYLELCVKLGKPNTIAHKGYEKYGLSAGMMEVDMSHSSVQLAMQKLYLRLNLSPPSFGADSGFMQYRISKNKRT